MGQRRRSKLGRPRLDRERKAYAPIVEEQVINRLDSFSSQANLQRGTYAERIIALAHGFDSPFLAPLPLELPAALGLDELRAFIAHFEVEQCTPVTSDVPARAFFVRLDKELADRIDAWCDEHDVDYSAYVRSILRRAAGFDTTDSLRPQHVQSELIDLDGGHAVAS